MASRIILRYRPFTISGRPTIINHHTPKVISQCHLIAAPSQTTLYPKNYFSTLEPALNTTTAPPPRKDRNILHQIGFKTTGQAFYLLRKKGAGKNFIRRSEFRGMCRAAQPGVKKNGANILQALREFRVNNAFLLDIHTAEVAVEAIVKSCGREDAGWVLARGFLDRGTGLYFAMESVDDIFEMMLLKPDGDGGEDASLVPAQVFYELWKRASFCENKLKKRAERKYLKQLQVKQVENGPTVDTVDLAVRACVMMGTNEKSIYYKIVAPFNKWGRFQGLSVKEETMEFLRQAVEDGKVKGFNLDGDLESEDGTEEGEDTDEVQDDKDEVK